MVRPVLVLFGVVVIGFLLYVNASDPEGGTWQAKIKGLPSVLILVFAWAVVAYFDR